MKTGVANLCTKCCQCTVAGETSYSFTGLPLPPLCRSLEGEAVIKALVDSESYPGPFKTYRLRSTATSWKQILDVYFNLELVQVFESNEYQITMVGYNHLTSCRVIDELKAVLALRHDLALKDRTVWELMRLVELDGWCILPWVPRSKVKPLDLNAELTDDNNKLYFNGRSCEIGTPYLHCILRRAELVNAGVPVPEL